MIDFVQNLIDALSLGSLYALVALGIGLLFGILRLVNFAHGDFITLGAYALIVPSADVVATMFIGSWNWALVIPAVCAIVVVVALLTDVLVFRPLRRTSAPTLMIASFAVSYMIQNGVLMAYGARPKSANLWPGLTAQILVGGVRVPLLQVVTIVTTLVLMGLLTLFLFRTRWGVQMRAAAEDFRMAQYLGVRGNFVIGLAFAVSGVLAAAVSLLFLAQTGSLSNVMGVPLALFAFVAVVVGGMGSLPGAVIGGFVLGLAEVASVAKLGSSTRDAVAFIVLFAILLLRPRGLLGRRRAREA